MMFSINILRPAAKTRTFRRLFRLSFFGSIKRGCEGGHEAPPWAPHAAPAPLPAQTHVFTEKPPDRPGNEVLASCAKFPISSEFDCLLQSGASFPQARCPPLRLTCSRDAPEIMDHTRRWGQVSHVHDR